MEKEILEAIADLKIIKFVYAGKKRTCEPHVYGVSNAQNQLLCYQLAGGSQAGGIPEWRRFDLTGIKQLRITNKTFEGKRPVPKPHSLGWTSIISVVK
jgi:hypothetical protein